jgi:hypothetical protein
MRQPGRGDYLAKPLGNIAVEQVGDDVELAFDKGMADARKLHSLLGQVIEPGGRHIDIVFDGPPSHESGRFVEVEDEHGASIKVGYWVQRGDGYWALRLPDSRALLSAVRNVLALHTKSKKRWHDHSYTCTHCDSRWPCPTVKALTDALEGGE